MECIDCGKYTYTTYHGIGALCPACAKQRTQNRILEDSKSVVNCESFKNWDSGDMSELFWIHLGRYVKEPNQESINMMYMAYMWACHTSHGISNSFRHALEWAKIDIYAEHSRWMKK